MNQKERAKHIREVAMSALRSLTEEGKPVGRSEWVNKTQAMASCSKSMAYSAVRHLIANDRQVGSEPKKEGGSTRVYFLRTEGGDIPPEARNSSPQATKPRARKKSGEDIQGFLRRVALEIVGELPPGKYIKIGDWKAEILNRASHEISPDISLDSAVHTATYYGVIKDGKVQKGDRGMYRSPQGESIGDEPEEAPKSDSGEEAAEDKQREERFYAPLATYLRDVLLECDGAIDSGDLSLGGIWGNPDVIGVAKSFDNAPMTFTEMVSAEVKVGKDTRWLMAGFGQACAYKNFSHQSYLAIPKGASSESRLISLCRHFGIGLVVFDENQSPENRNPEEVFMLLNRARKDPPADLSQANKYLQKIRRRGRGAILSLEQWAELFRAD